MHACMQEKEANSIEIPNISYEVFESMMRFVYTGQVTVKAEIAFELLQASAVRMQARMHAWGCSRGATLPPHSICVCRGAWPGP